MLTALLQFLISRKLRVLFDDACSRYIEVVSRVPQR